jgi:adsorption protein B
VGLDDWVVACLFALAVWTLLSGLDDLFISLVWACTAKKSFSWPSDAELDEAVEGRTAIFVPLWHEDGVIRQMLDRNLAEIRYRNFDIFVGVYPNDEATSRAVAEAERVHGRVHLAEVPHDGPTSKADCLNAIWRSMRSYEEVQGVRFETIVIHDAEDLVHAESLRLINWYMRDYQMVQVPVLALPTGCEEFTHGLYCDEFAEYQSKDIPVRQRLGGFLPSNGVGTGFERDALERMAAGRGGRMFDPGCLTEDYETGIVYTCKGAGRFFCRCGCAAASRWRRESTFRAVGGQRYGSGAVGWPVSFCKAGRSTVGAKMRDRRIGSGATARDW